MVMVMEYLGSYTLLHETLFSPEALSAPLPPDATCPLRTMAAALGSFLGGVHAATHSSCIGAERKAELISSFENAELRGLQLEYVFSQCFREAEKAAALRADSDFMAKVEEIKELYRGESHGSVHKAQLRAK